MPSLADIPENLLSQEKKLNFLTWLHNQPIETGPRRRLLSLWRQETNSEIDHNDFVAAMKSAPDYPNHNSPDSNPRTAETTATNEQPNE